MILDGILAASCDNDDVIDSGCHSLLDHILNHRFVNQRQHFLGLRFGRWQESRPQTCCREYRFPDFHVVRLSATCWPGQAARCSAPSGELSTGPRQESKNMSTSHAETPSDAGLTLPLLPSLKAPCSRGLSKYRSINAGSFGNQSALLGGRSG